MTSFLGRLAERAVGSAYGVEPRLRGRFESGSQPIPPGDTSEFVEGVEQVQFSPRQLAWPDKRSDVQPDAGIETGKRATPFRQPPLTRPQPTMSAQAPVSALGQSNEPLAVASPTTPRRRAQGDSEPSGRALNPPNTAHDTPAAGIPLAQRGGAEQPPVHKLPAGVDRPLEGRKSDPAPLPAPIRPGRSHPRDVREAGEPVFDISRPRVFEPDVTPLQWTARTQGRIGSAGHPPGISQKDAASNRSRMAIADGGVAFDRESDSTVYVRIGRIDVEAVMPPAQPARKSSQPPVETLDEYLRRKAGPR